VRFDPNPSRRKNVHDLSSRRSQSHWSEQDEDNVSG
jgi:hypothetical protein